MKRGIIFFVFLWGFILFLPFISPDTITGDTVTGEVITGEAMSQQISMKIFVEVTGIYLSLDRPLNETYRFTNFIPVDYTIQNYESLWYNIDNTENITLTEPSTFSTIEGAHTLYLFANDSSSNLKMRTISFFVNTSAFIVNYDEFKGLNKGDSTDFDVYTYERLQDLYSVVLENTEYGKIEFHQSINLTNDSNPLDARAYIDENVEISFNKVEIDINDLPNLNKSASIWLYGLDFDYPKILRNGEDCPSDICIFESYNFSTGTLKFNVTMFSYYSAKENTTEGEEGDGGSGGSSGGSGVGIFEGPDVQVPVFPQTSYFDLDKEEIKVELKQGETKQEIIRIRNNDNRTLQFLILQERLDEVILIDENSFSLKPGEEKEVILDFIARENNLPDLYLGKIIVESEGSSQEIFVSVEVETKKALFDVKATIPWRYKNIKSGQEILSEIELTNLGDVGKVDVSVEYSIRDRDNNVLIKEHEELAVETRVEYEKKFLIPEDIESGDYVFYVAIFYDGEVASSSSWFSIKDKRTINWALASLYAFLLFIVFSIIRLYQLYVKEERREHVKKIEEEEARQEKLNKSKDKINTKKVIKKKVFNNPEKRKGIDLPDLEEKKSITDIILGKK